VVLEVLEIQLEGLVALGIHLAHLHLKETMAVVVQISAHLLTELAVAVEVQVRLEQTQRLLYPEMGAMELLRQLLVHQYLVPVAGVVVA
jgi:hypothetical protein